VGNVLYGKLQADVERLGEARPWLCPRGAEALTELFPELPSIHRTRGRSDCCTGIYHGLVLPDPIGAVCTCHRVTVSFRDADLYFDGLRTALFFEIVPGGDLEFLMGVRYEDAKEFESAVLRCGSLPLARERVNTGEFHLLVRRTFSRGNHADGSATVRPPRQRTVDHGDVHVVNDPLMGQARIRHRSFVMGWEISTTVTRSTSSSVGRTAARLWDYASMVTEWNNYMVQVPPAPNVLQLLLSASQEKQPHVRRQLRGPRVTGTS